MGQEFLSPGTEWLLGTAEDEPCEPGMEVARELARISRLLVGAEDVEATLAMTCRLAVEHIPGCEHADVSLLSRGAIRSAGATSATALAVDGLQYVFGEGPCIDASRGHDMVIVEDLLTDGRWPRFAAAATQTENIRSVLAYRLFVGERTMGALNLYSSQPGAFDGGSRTADLGYLFAGHTAVALAGAQAIEGLRAALDSRETISVAMGILMARQQITRSQAFDVLRRASQRENVKLREIAARIAGEGDDVLAPG